MWCIFLKLVFAFLGFAHQRLTRTESENGQQTPKSTLSPATKLIGMAVVTNYTFLPA